MHVVFFIIYLSTDAASLHIVVSCVLLLLIFVVVAFLPFIPREGVFRR